MSNGNGRSIINWELIIALVIIAIALALVGINWETLHSTIIAINHWENLVASLLVGSVGSAGYFSALMFGFIRNDEAKDKICPPGRSHCCRIGKVFWFMSIGGIIAMTFQIPQMEFVPIQAFVLGATWPSVVTQILTQQMQKNAIEVSLQESSESTDALKKPKN